MKRIVIVESVYHQGEGGQPTVIESRWSRQVQSDDQPYIRRFKVGTEWQPLDEGWVKLCSQLLLSNEGGPKPTVIPTPEERTAAEAKMIEVGVRAGADTLPILSLPPGETLRCSPVDSKKLSVRCIAGDTWCTVATFPS